MLPLMRQCGLVVVLLGLPTVPWVGPGFATLTTEQSPTQSIKRTMKELMGILEDESLKAWDRTEDRRKALEDVLRERVNYEEMAKRALGSQWSALEEVQRQEFVDLFVTLLRDSFANHVTELVEDRIVYLGEQRYDMSFAEVHTRFIGPKVDTSVDFRVINQNGQWRVYDVVVEGASVVYNYRAQFTRVMKEVTYRGLLKQLKERTATLKRFETSLTH